MNETLKTIHEMHSTHGNFRDAPLPREHLEAILAASVRAPNAGNVQSYAIIVCEDKAVMKELSGYQAPVALIYCADVQRNMDLAKHLGLSYTVDPAWVLMTGITDTVLAAQTAVIAARSLGVDSLISNGVQRGDVSRLWQLLDLPPKNGYPVLALYLGYADQEPGARSGRILEPGVIHRGRYQQRDAGTIEAIIAATDAPEYSASQSPNWHEQGYAHCMEMFFKGPGTRAARAYQGLAPAMARAGIKIERA